MRHQNRVFSGPLFACLLLICVCRLTFAQWERPPLQDVTGGGSVSLAQAIETQLHMLNHSGHIHTDNPDLAAEHQAFLDLFPLASDNSVFVALNGGSWFDPATWLNAEIPGNGDSVYIPSGVSVVYDDVSDAKLDRLGVDGELHFAVDRDTRLKLDTLLLSPQAVFTIGDLHNPVPGGIRAELIFHRANGPLQLADDPLLLSKGLVSHAAVRIVGVDKTDHLKTSQHPAPGMTSLRFDTLPANWNAGDKLVVGAVRNALSSQSHQFETYEDEVVRVTAVKDDGDGGALVSIDRPLIFDHTPPDRVADVALNISVANYSRNIFIGTETNADVYLDDGKTVPLAERGHVMFMHNDDVIVKNAEFFELGRTDKAAFFSETNVAGRYSLHYHRTGLNSLNLPAIAEGNAIWGSPGWGIVHHDANLNVDFNAVFGVVGSGIVAEAGNETGRWTNNIVVQTIGVVRTFNAEQSAGPDGNPPVDHPAYQAEVLNNTFAQGEAYGMKSRLLEISNNVAISANGAGFSFWPHGTDGPSHISSNGKDFEFVHGYDPFYGQNSIYPGKVPTRDFRHNEVVASRHALNTSANKIAHRHDMDVIVEKLLAWNVDQPIMSFYQENYIIKDSVFIRGAGNTQPGHYYNGTEDGSSASHIHDPLEFKLINNHFEGYDTITKEPMTIILGNTVVGSSVKEMTGPRGLFREGATADNDSIDVIDNSGQWLTNPYFENRVGHLSGFVNIDESDLTMTATYDRFWVTVYKTDSIGEKVQLMGSPVPKEFRGASQHNWWRQNAVTDGYYRGSDGGIYLVVEAVFSDRVSGTVGSIEVAIELQFLNGDPSGLPEGSIDAGPLPVELDQNRVGKFKIVDLRCAYEGVVNRHCR